LVDGDVYATGQVMHSAGLTACLEKIRELSQWDQRKAQAQAAAFNIG
jgi:hypothetical protein